MNVKCNCIFIYLFIYLFIAIFVEPVCGERYIVVTTSVRCMCVCASGFVRTITSTLMNALQNNLEQLFSLRSSNAI